MGSPEKKTYGYRERDEDKRQEFTEELAQIPVEQRVYLDEAGMDERDDYDYGYNEKGQRYYALKIGKRQGRVNMIAAQCQNQLIAPFTVEGTCNREVFEVWLETCLLPQLQAGQVVIMDNAAFHKGGRIQELIQAAGCRVLYLPPYSPDLNPIEKSWSTLKSRIRHCKKQFETLREAMESVLRNAS